MADILLMTKSMGSDDWVGDSVATISGLNKEFEDFADYVNNVEGQYIINRDWFKERLVEELPNGNTESIFNYFKWENFDRYYKKYQRKNWGG